MLHNQPARGSNLAALVVCSTLSLLHKLSIYVCVVLFSDPMLLVSDEDIVEESLTAPTTAPTGDFSDTGAVLTLGIGTRQPPRSTGVVYVEKEGKELCSTPSMFVSLFTGQFLGQMAMVLLQRNQAHMNVLTQEGVPS